MKRWIHARTNEIEYPELKKFVADLNDELKLYPEYGTRYDEKPFGRETAAMVRILADSPGHYSLADVALNELGLSNGDTTDKWVSELPREVKMKIDEYVDDIATRIESMGFDIIFKKKQGEFYLLKCISTR